jgi:pyrroloquinoline quinone (PQQ) biosynthesis protein C
MTVPPNGLPNAMRQIVVDRFYGPSPPEGMQLLFHPDRAVQAALVHEHWQFLRGFPRWVGAVIHGTPHLDVIEYEVENLYGELVHDPMAANGHYALVLEAGIEAGLSREEIVEGTPHPKLARALEDWYAIARDRPWVETMAAVHGTEMLADQKLKEMPGYSLPYQMGDAEFLDRSGLTEKGRRFLATTRADTEHAGRAADLVAKYATGPGEADAVLATFRRSMDNMGAYMEAVVDRVAEYRRRFEGA